MRNEEILRLAPRRCQAWRLAESCGPAFVRRILGLSLLSPDLVRAILDGSEPDGLSLNWLIVGLPARWEEQG